VQKVRQKTRRKRVGVMDYKTFTIARREHGGIYPFIVYDSYGNWFDSFRSIENAKAWIDELADDWLVCPHCFSDPSYVSAYGYLGWSCAKCESDFEEPLYPAKGTE